MQSAVSAPAHASLHQWCGQACAGEQVLAVRVAVQGLCLSHPQQNQPCTLQSGWTGLLAFTPGTCAEGDAWVLPALGVNAYKLQAFVDQAVEPVAPTRRQECCALEVPAMALTQGLFEGWYLTLAAAGGASGNPIANWLRCSERYKVIQFLLRESGAGEKLSELARRYGVSVSHFRRLCHQAFGGAAKPELRAWRTAKALLALTLDPGDISLTEIALSFGFSSSSHFSKEIRELVGICPSSLNDITRLTSR